MSNGYRYIYMDSLRGDDDICRIIDTLTLRDPPPVLTPPVQLQNPPPGVSRQTNPDPTRQRSPSPVNHTPVASSAWPKQTSYPIRPGSPASSTDSDCSNVSTDTLYASPIRQSPEPSTDSDSDCSSVSTDTLDTPSVREEAFPGKIRCA